MKWPSRLTVNRHAQTAYNVLRKKKNEDPEYQAFKRAYEADHRSPEARRLAEIIWGKYRLGYSDYKTPLTEEGKRQGVTTGQELAKLMERPDIIFCSPYVRTRDTYTQLCKGWPGLASAQLVIEDRIREQEHGLSILYSDWRVFQTMHPEQKYLREMDGPYWYQYPQGESVSQVRDRTRDVLSMLIRECAGQKVMLITHHLTILSLRANLERLSPEEFIRLDKEETPVNCGVTDYVAHERPGKSDKLVLDFYNRKLY